MLRTLFSALVAVSLSLFALVTQASAQGSYSSLGCSPVMTTKLREPVIEKTSSAHQYRTRIKQEARATGVNFCGHYSFVSIDFTGPFQINFLVDRLNGKVYPAPGSDIGVMVDATSRFLVVNPPDPETDIPGVESPAIQFFIWTGKEFKEIPDPNVDTTS